MKIDAEKIHAVVVDCLYQPEEVSGKNVPEGAVLADGIMHSFAFHPERLESHREEVRAWLMALPHQFRKSEGGGWSFLNACVDEDGEQWGEHLNMDELFSLGQALGLVKCCLPRAMWSALPGGMPYYVVED